MGATAPAYGMLGTLIGLILMLTDLNNPDALGTGDGLSFNYYIFMVLFLLI